MYGCLKTCILNIHHLNIITYSTSITTDGKSPLSKVLFFTLKYLLRISIFSLPPKSIVLVFQSKTNRGKRKQKRQEDA